MLGKLVRARRDALQRLVRGLVRRRDADLLADDDADAHIDVALLDVLVDVVVREAREGGVAGEDLDVGLVAAARPEHHLRDAPHLRFTEHVRLPSWLPSPRRTLSRDGRGGGGPLFDRRPVLRPRLQLLEGA